MIALNKIWKGFLSLERFVMFVMCMLLVVLIFSSVIMRYVLQINYIGLEDISTLIAYWIYFIGGAYCSYKDTHISADMVSVLWKDGKGKQLFLFIRSFLTAALFLIATYCSFDLVTYAFEAKTKTISLNIPYQYMYISICVGFILMSTYSIYHVIQNFLIILKTEAVKPDVD